MFSKIVFLLLLLTVLPPAAPAVPPPLKQEGLDVILFGEKPPAPITGEAIRKNLAGEWHQFTLWTHREASSLQDLLAGWLVILLVVLGGTLVLRKLRGRLDAGSLGWRIELLLVLGEPLLLLTGLAGCFLFLVPVLRSLPGAYRSSVRIFGAGGKLRHG